MKKLVKKQLVMNKKFLIISILFYIINYPSMGVDPIVKYLKCNYKTNPIGIGHSKIYLGWEIHSLKENTYQTAYQIEASNSLENLLNNRLIWNSGKVYSDSSINVVYKGPKIKSRERIYWRVKIWDNYNRESDWSEPAYFEAGLLNNTDWKAKWITPDLIEKKDSSNPCPYLRKSFVINKDIKNARLYITAKGLYISYINGKNVTENLFTPGWTSYNKRIQYQVYDVTNHLQRGKNVIGVILGDGWFRGPITWQHIRNFYGDKLALLVQLEIEHKDGSKTFIVSDNSWKSNTGPIISSEIYNGETYDARLELENWNCIEYNDKTWKGVKILSENYEKLVETESEPVKIVKTLKPLKRIITPRGELVFDFGQVITGWTEINVKGNRGTTIILKHFEVLDKEGNVYTDNLRLAKQEDRYTFRSNDIEKYEPHFTFHGFRYVHVSGINEIDTNNIIAKVIHTDLEFTGNFECSDPLINRLQENIQWSLRGNFLDIPTDCPQRDERLGWTGDAQIFAPTACFNVNAVNFFSKWLKDFIVDQTSDGKVPWVIPNVVVKGGGTGWSDGTAATGWADAIITIPYTLYKTYGNKQIILDMYFSMKKWIDYMISQSPHYLFNTGFHFGDWLAFSEYYSYNYNAPDYGYAGAHTDKDLIATAYFYYSTKLFSEMAEAIGNSSDAQHYKQLLPKIKHAFCKEFLTSTGRLTSNTQTAYSIALMFGLIPDSLIENAAKRLANDVMHFGHLTTGFLGTPLLNHALTEYGYPELAYMLLFNKRYPSWLYPITMGSTTIWERWDGIKPDGTFQDPGMNSFNHYAYGAIGEWLYKKVAGINFFEPGYKKILIKPYICEELKFVKATYKSMYGQINSNWKILNDKVIIEIEIPVNTSADILIPYSNPEKIKINDNYVKLIKAENNWSKFTTGSGYYKIEFPLIDSFIIKLK